MTEIPPSTVVPASYFAELQADLDAPPQGSERVRAAVGRLREVVGPNLPRGLRIAEAWLDHIRAATGQEPDPATVQRVTGECHWGRPCGSCHSELGEPHADGCSVARCLHTGLQRLDCPGARHDCGEQVWDGVWPGSSEAIEYGWFIDRESGRACGPEHPHAIPDAGRVHPLYCDWDRAAQRWVKRAGIR